MSPATQPSFRSERSFRAAILPLACGFLLTGTVFLAACTPGESSLPPAKTATYTAVPSATPAPTLTPQPSLTPTITPLPACFIEPGRIIRTTYPGFVVDEAVPVIIYLPPCYDEIERRYPALYLLHGYGSGMDETQWDQLGILDEAERRFQAGEEAYIIVMPLQPDPIFVNSMGGTGSYEEELLDGLLPYVDTTFRTQTEAVARAIAGISRGGVWALEIAFRNPEQFNIVAGVSPALHLNYVRAAYDPYEIARTAEALPAHIFLTAGDQERDFRKAMLELSAVLEAEGIEHLAGIHSGGHVNESWQNLLPQLLDFIAMSWSAD
ncbi:MAG: hypothetical protein JXA97_01185 [Anaerolineales bacterium]|nr:hypothetical protein [Anaerolineales bacterium]